MPFNTVTVCVAVAPTVVSTWFSHYLNRRSHREKPTREISYHEGLHIIREFMYYASHHTIEDIQAFTSQKVATPRWVKSAEVKIGDDYLDSAADKLITQLGPRGIAQVGGIKWWQWRGGTPLKAEWIEMRRDYQERKSKENSRCKRVILYVHGGAYFFGSVDASRYQMQRHARKLRGRVLARYRLAPQFPFPCGLQDCMATYLYLLSVQEPTEVVLSGDSAGAGMVLTMLVIIRDQGLPLPAGAVLLSPWVDLLHSFPSMGSDGKRDFLPLYGFMQRPSISWPPPNADELDAILKNAKRRPGSIPGTPSIAMPDNSRDLQTAIQGFSVHGGNSPESSQAQDNNGPNGLPSIREHLSIVINGKVVEIKDQVQMYTTNELLNHPLVSPIFQPSLGGLPPLLVLAGGGELLRDEQIYIAHKAANPPAYPPSEDTLNRHDPYREIITKYQPTYVQLQIWDDLCHVAPTLSWTKPAKHMFRSIAQFSAWALARAQDSDIDIPNGEDEVDTSTDGPNGLANNSKRQPGNQPDPKYTTCVGKAGDPLPPFRNHMIRQRADRNGRVYPLPDESLFPSLNIPPSKIGAVNAVPLRRWMSAKQLWDTKYAREKLRVQEKRIRELIYGVAHYEPGELPPPSSLAARKSAYLRRVEERQRKSRAMTIWSRWGAKADMKALTRDARGLFSGASTEKSARPANRQTAGGVSGGPSRSVPQNAIPSQSTRPGPTSRTRKVSDKGQATDDASRDFRHQASPSRREPDRFDFILTTPTQTSDEHIYSTEPGSNNTNHGSQMHYVLSGGIPVRDIPEPKRPVPSENNEYASAASVRHFEGVISPLAVPKPAPEPVSDASSARFDWRTPNEYASLSRQDTPSIYSQDTNNEPAFQSISAARGGVAKGKKAAPSPSPARAPATPSPKTRVTDNNNGSYFKFKPKKMLYDFESAHNLEPSDTEPFPPFPASSSRNPSIGSKPSSKPSFRQGSIFRSRG